MIPADHITFDGDKAWTLLVELAQYCRAGEFPQLLDRPCEWCQRHLSSGIWPNCPECNRSGRHTFEIEVECPTCDEHCVAYDRTYRVAIVPGMVLPILLARSELPDSTCIVDWKNRYCGNPRFAVSPLDTHGYCITLPPAARPGMWAVQLKGEVI